MVISNIGSVVLETSQKFFVDNPFGREILRIDPKGKYAILKGVASMVVLSGFLISGGYYYYKGELTKVESDYRVNEKLEFIVTNGQIVKTKKKCSTQQLKKNETLQVVSKDPDKTRMQLKLQTLKEDLDTVLSSGRALIEEVEKGGKRDSEDMIKIIEMQMQKYTDEYSNIVANYS